MRLFVFSRHAESTLNHEHRVNGDPSRPAPLTEQGRMEARLLGLQLRSVTLDACVHTRFPRTRETAQLALAERDVPVEVEPELDDIKIGGLATLVLVYGLSRGVLFLLLHTQSDQTLRVAGFLADLVLAPIIFLGSALLYSDQAARVVVDRSARGR